MSKDKKIVFIDRDGVINKDPGGWTEHNYVTRWKDFHFISGSKEAISKLSAKRYDIIIISNQAGVSKGFYSNCRLDSITTRMLYEIRKAGGRIRKSYYCIHQDSDRCGCRKPKIGLVKRAEKEMDIKARGSYFIGDDKVDIEAGKKARLVTILVLSGKTRLEDISKWRIKPNFIVKDLLEAVNLILEGKEG